MAQQTSSEDAPFGVFRSLYSLMTWSGLVLLIAIFTWLVWTLFTRTASGTVRSQALDTVRPTLAAVAASMAGAEGACPLVQLPASCVGCHAIAGTSANGQVGPELTNIRLVSEERIAAADYAGSATTAEEYIRESILEPNAFIVPGAGYAAAGSSLMPAAVGEALPQAELDALITDMTCVPEESE